MIITNEELVILKQKLDKDPYCLQYESMAVRQLEINEYSFIKDKPLLIGKALWNLSLNKKSIQTY